MSTEKARQAERLIAKRYELQGYAVTVEPSMSQLPFSLGSYRPDLLAVNGKEHLLIEVKTAGSPLNAELIFDVDQEVQRHPGWKFLIVTVRDDELVDDASSGPTASGGVTIRSLQARLAEVDRLGIRAETAGFLVPVLWTVLVSALRALISKDGEVADGYTDFSLINKAYSSGHISAEQHQTLKKFLSLRNDEVHGLESKATEADCWAMRDMAESLTVWLQEGDRSR
ncbi:hypothetical protein [Mitsuaria sp. CC2]|jgi:hypothetical protein|uniref:hypothetical protein n=1 Tax=Roseateles TaxID=93681 RepID=UPI003B8D7D33